MPCRRITIDEYKNLPQETKSYDTENQCENLSCKCNLKCCRETILFDASDCENSPIGCDPRYTNDLAWFGLPQSEGWIFAGRYSYQTYWWNAIRCVAAGPNCSVTYGPPTLTPSTRGIINWYLNSGWTDACDGTCCPNGECPSYVKSTFNQDPCS